MDRHKAYDSIAELAGFDADGQPANWHFGGLVKNTLNGIVAPPLLLMIMLIGNNSCIIKDKVNNHISNTLGWFTTAAMTIAAVALLLILGLGQ